MSINSILNNVLGKGNFFFQESDNNTINISYDNTIKKHAVSCPKCNTSAEDSLKEEEIGYNKFTCVNCDHKFYEHDETVKKISSYADLDGVEEKKFKRLIEAVNHDLRRGDVDIAYERCLKNTEIYGLTAQMYEWGAFTLFVSKPIDYWINNKLRGVLEYLEKAKSLDVNGTSETYDTIAASIARRYFQGIMSLVEKIKRAWFICDKNENHEEIYKEELKKMRQEIFKFLLEVESCFEIYPDFDFLNHVLLELYGYGEIAWFERKFSSFYKKIEDDESGKVRLLKGYVWDFHKVVSNCEHIFTECRETPASYAVQIELLLKEQNSSQEFPEIMVGSEYDDNPLSTKTALKKMQIKIWSLFIIIGFILMIKTSFLLVLFYLVLGGVFLYFKDKDGNIPDDLRRLTNKHTGRF